MKTISLLLALICSSLAAQMPVAQTATTISNGQYGNTGFTMLSLVNNSVNTNLVLDETNVFGALNGIPAVGRVDFYVTQAVTFPTGVTTACSPIANNTKFASTASTITAKCNQAGSSVVDVTGAKVWMGVFQPGATALKKWDGKLIVSPGWRLDIQVYPIDGNMGLVTYIKWFEQPIIP
jgi:hypothetical protein